MNRKNSSFFYAHSKKHYHINAVTLHIKNFNKKKNCHDLFS